MRAFQQQEALENGTTNDSGEIMRQKNGKENKHIIFKQERMLNKLEVMKVASSQS